MTKIQTVSPLLGQTSTQSTPELTHHYVVKSSTL